MRNEPNKTIKTLLSRFKWEVDAVIDIPTREPKFAVIDSPDVHRFTKQFAQTLYPNGLYLHQKLAVESFAKGNNVCVATSTASGKTAVFHLAMVETFSRESSTRVLCMYPTKALASEQAQRWQVILHKINENARVGIISGDVPIKNRSTILRQSHVVVVTPDIVHAWLLPQCGDSHVRSFLGKLRLIIIDEAHTYTGVFGSNTAFLFRRLRHICDYLKSSLRFIAASATIASPEEHLNKLTGLDFAIIEEKVNGSQRYPTTIRLITPPAHEDIMTGLPKLLTALGKTSLKSITFVDSRKQVELITSIVTRDSADDGMAPDSQTEEDSFYDYSDSLQHLSRLSILPYRAGYEASDREAIQNRLQSGSLSGVISTSALELGIDIPHLDIAILVGVPSSSTSLYQRIGRVGRQKPGEVLIINSGTPYDTAIFAHPEDILNRPPAQSALYLENLRIQYIHALCLARLGGEHDQSRPDLGEYPQFSTNVSWADGFLELCTKLGITLITPFHCEIWRLNSKYCLSMVQNKKT
ncbi:MAG: DEAD/DEAH box helicase [Armatimonadetes bacterium]|nr:DEAD/DEAH box helicase [Armatimonadota bacterium]